MIKHSENFRIQLSLIAVMTSMMPLAAFAGLQCDKVHATKESHAEAKNSLNIWTDNYVKGNEFRITRGFQGYLTELGSGFGNHIALLKDGATWLDAGAGFSIPQIEFLKNKGIVSYENGSGDNIVSRLLNVNHLPNLKMIASVFKNPNAISRRKIDPDEPFTVRDLILNDLRGGEHFIANDYKTLVIDKKTRKIDQRIGDIVNLDIHNQVDVLTDVYGPIIYSNMTDIISKYHSMLSANGQAFIHIDPIRLLESDRDKNSVGWLYSDGLSDEQANNQSYNLKNTVAFFRAIQGFDVEFQYSMMSDKDHHFYKYQGIPSEKDLAAGKIHSTSVILKKNSERLQIPELEYVDTLIYKSTIRARYQLKEPLP